MGIQVTRVPYLTITNVGKQDRLTTPSQLQTVNTDNKVDQSAGPQVVNTAGKSSRLTDHTKAITTPSPSSVHAQPEKQRQVHLAKAPHMSAPAKSSPANFKGYSPNATFLRNTKSGNR